MCRNIFRGFILTSAVLGLFGGFSATARAAQVSDDAGFFSREARDKADTRLAELKKETGKDVRIETVKSVPSDKKESVAKMSPAEKSKFFLKWASDRATAERVKGIFILICKEPGHVHVVANRQTREEGFGVTDEKLLTDKFLEGFKHKDYDKALADGVDTVSQTVRKLHLAHESGYLPGPLSHDKSAAPHNTGVAHNNRIEHHDTVPPRHVPQSRGLGLMGWLVIAVVVFLGIRLIGALFGGARAGGGYGGGYGPGYGGGYGGGGMMSNIMGGLFGAMAGNWLYHSFFGGNDHLNPPGSFGGGSTGGYDGGQSDSAGSGGDDDYQGSGGDFDSGDSGGGGGDFGGGADFGGGDFGGSDFGGDSGGGDF